MELITYRRGVWCPFFVFETRRNPVWILTVWLRWLVMFDGWCSVLMQYKLSLACLLASIQHVVTNGPFVLSNFFPVPVGHCRFFFFFFVSLSCSLSGQLLFSLCLALSLSHSLPLILFLHFFFAVSFSLLFIYHPLLCQFSICLFLSILATSTFFYILLCHSLPYFHLIIPLLYPSVPSLSSRSSLLLFPELFQRCLEYFWLCDSPGQHYWHPGHRAWGK